MNVMIINRLPRPWNEDYQLFPKNSYDQKVQNLMLDLTSVDRIKITPTIDELMNELHFSIEIDSLLKNLI